ncbi:MAG: hypothetical protein K2J20_06885 [Bacilli bacterium]|nr:hypothetical protein [Bacilli bacterium]
MEDQIIRIAASTPDYQEQPDLFMVDANIKRIMIKDDLVRIVEEFLSGGNDYIFGKLSDKAKDRIRASVGSNNQIRNRVVEIIANYTIAEELERGEARVRAMGRFH